MNKQIIIKDLLVNYNETGEKGIGRTMLFLHGWRSSKEAWNEVVNKVIKLSSHQVYAMDLPGFGGSQAPRQEVSVGDYAGMVAEFIKKLDLHEVVIIGHSFGGRVGIKLAAQQPELVGKLVLADSAGFPSVKFKRDFMAAAAKIVKPLFKPRFMQPLRKMIYRLIGAEDYVATPELQKTFVNAVSEDLSADMKKISCPTLIINGENDKDTPVEFGERMNTLIPNSKFIILPNAGHFSFVDQPEKFMEELNKFLS